MIKQYVYNNKKLNDKIQKIAIKLWLTLKTFSPFLCAGLSIIPFFFSLYFILCFDSNFESFQFIYFIKKKVSVNTDFFFRLNTAFAAFETPFGFDGISLLICVLTAFIFPICIWLIISNVMLHKRTLLLCLFLVLEITIIMVLSVMDVFAFYLYFEFTLIPMFLIIGLGGSRFRKIKAAYFLFFYTLIGSIFMFSGLFYIMITIGGTLFDDIFSFIFSMREETILWILFFITFSIKIPMVPFHIWLPEAHVEAPTTGSIILASILLKLGAYSFLRFSLALFPLASVYFMPVTFLLCLIGTVYATFSTIRQVDIKRIIAYSSIAHMNLALLGLFSITFVGIAGAFYLFLGHGLLAGALFFNVGVLYDRYHTRIIFYFGGLVTMMPLFAFFFLFLLFSNIGFPGTFNFISEFLILNSLLFFSLIILVLTIFPVVLSVIYNIWLYNRITFGNLKIMFIQRYSDLNDKEFVINLNLVLLILIFGFYSNLIWDLAANSFTNNIHFIISSKFYLGWIILTLKSTMLSTNCRVSP